MWKQKIFLLFASLLLLSSAMAQEQKEVVLKTDVSEVTVFISGAQVLRKKSVDLLPGRTKIRLTNLSPYIDAKSVQMKLAGEAMVLSVNHQASYTDSLKNSVPVKGNDVLLKEVEDKIIQANIERQIILEEQAFLAENRKIGGANTGVGLVSLRETANYYRERISALKRKDSELHKQLLEWESQKSALLNNEKQEGALLRNPRTLMGEVVVEVESKKATRVQLELAYYVKNASWYPTYDIRAIDTDRPIQLIYKANVNQNTKEDWKNVKLKISSANPNQGGVLPQLRTYQLNYHTAPPRYDLSGNGEITGVVTDNKGETMIGVAVAIPGSTIGTVTDMDGKFSLAIPQEAKALTFSYIGYVQKTVPISSSFMRVQLEDDGLLMEEVVVTGYGRKKSRSVAAERSEDAPKKSADRSDLAMPTTQVENQTVVEFEVAIPYSIQSDNKKTTIEVDRYELPASYEYFAIPKISRDAFLLANITDWERYNLLEGEANIFFENTYVGKTVLDTRQVSDTLNISLGRDKSILINREKGRDYNAKKFLGTRQENTREWKISVRNNKSQTVNFVLLDQVPVATLSEIEVTPETLSNGELNSRTGEVKWKFKLKPTEKREFDLKYKVKYPKDRVLNIE